MAGALAAGTARGFVVHGSDGLDEITTTGPTLAFEIRMAGGARTLEPEDFAVPQSRLADLKGGDKARNLEIATRRAGGARGPQRDIVLANSRRGAGGRRAGRDVPGRRRRGCRFDRCRSRPRQAGSPGPLHPAAFKSLRYHGNTMSRRRKRAGGSRPYRFSSCNPGRRF
jgi:hypothetical protein